MTTNKLIGLAAAVSIAAAVLLAQAKITPMDVKTGLWQSTSTVKMSGAMAIPPEQLAKMTPEQRERAEKVIQAMNQSASQRPERNYTNKGCVTKEDLTKDPFNQKTMEGMKCTEKLIRSTSSEAEVEQTCAGEEGSSTDVHMTIHAQDREHATGSGSVTVTMGGHTMKSDMTFQSKWLQDTCPADAE